MAIFPCALWCKSLVIYFIHDCLCLLIPFPKVASSPFSLYFGNQQFFLFVFLIGGWLLYIIVMDFAVHQYESSIGTRVSPSSWTTLHLPPHPVPLGVPERQLWVLCFVHQTCTSPLFYIWWYVCFNAILSSHPILAFSHWVQKSVLYICLLCCPAGRIVGTIFLNAIYMC